MDNHEVINYLIEKNNYKTYLEVGVESGGTFKLIKIENKECCDVSNSKWKLDTPITYLMSSDDMFAKFSTEKKYDIIFIDAMHREDYLDRDIINSLKHLNRGGIILCHDVLPTNYEMTSEQQFTIVWTGSYWKSVTKLQNQNISFHTLDQHNLGLAIIDYYDNPNLLQYPSQRCTLNYEYVFKNKGGEILTEQGKYIMHYITEEEFFKMY